MRSRTALLIPSLILLGCANSPTESRPEEPDAAALDAGTGALEGVAAPNLLAADTRPARETKPTSIKNEDDKYSTCAAVCAARETTCSSRCQDIGAGKASYGYYDWTYGWVKIVKSVALADCDQTPQSSIQFEGKTQELAWFWCCCEMPVVKPVEGDLVNVRSCTAICQASGTSCFDYHAWSSDETGGVRMWYTRESTGGSAYLVSSCDHVPAPTVNYANAVRTLAGYTCACY